MDAERVRVRIDAHVADVRMVRADKHNGLDWRMFVALNEALDELRSDAGVRARLVDVLPLVATLAKVEPLALVDAVERPANSAVESVGGVELTVPLTGLIDDVAAEAQRIAREVEKVEKELAGVAAKLANPQFAERAPEEVVAEVEEKGAQLRDRRDVLRRSLDRLKAVALWAMLLHHLLAWSVGDARDLLGDGDVAVTDLAAPAFAVAAGAGAAVVGARLRRNGGRGNKDPFHYLNHCFAPLTAWPWCLFQWPQ